MPASSDYTTIKLMRGNSAAVSGWIPEIAEPLIDMESSTLRHGDGSLRGKPVNTVTCHEISTNGNLNEYKIWGRYFFSAGAELESLPKGMKSTDKFFLIVESKELGTHEIFQTIKIISGDLKNKIYTRITTNNGILWSSWSDVSGKDFSDTGTGTTEGDTNLNNYIYSSTVYIKKMTNGPIGSDGCDGLLFTYRPSIESTEIYQTLYMLKCQNFAGKIFFRYSKQTNTDFFEPGYNWRELTDFLHTDLSNISPTTILKEENGGTGRNNGTVKQADLALRTLYGVGADLAEIYISDCELEKGDVVSISTKEDTDITKTNSRNFSKFLGIVSTKPGFILNPDQKDMKYAYPIARIGKVPCKVSGPCKKGDALVFDQKTGKLISEIKLLEGYIDIRLFSKICYANETKITDDESIIEVII